MKVIDLLNKIANGEEVPYRIRTNDREYLYDKYSNWYFFGKTSEDMFIDKGRFNDEVEIIEEEKKIPEKLSFGDVSGTPKRASENDIIDKINEIIDYLNSKGE